jgi:hypothetical protein
MSPETFSVTVALLVFAAGVLGLMLHRTLPEAYLTGGAHDMINHVVGLLTLLSALVLGLLIWTAHGVYSGQNAAVRTLASKALQLDRNLADYGPEAIEARAKLREGVGSTIRDIWGVDQTDSSFAAKNFSAAIGGLNFWKASLESLHPSTEAQKKAVDGATSAVEAIAQQRLEMSFALDSAVSNPEVWIVVVWTIFLALGFGLLSGGNVTSYIAVAVGSLAVASAVLLILGLSNPYRMPFRASPAPLEQVYEAMGKK